MRRQMDATLLQGQPPSPRIGALVAILRATDQVHRVVEHDGMSSKDLTKRAEEIAEGDWAAKGVADAIAATNAAVMASINASTNAATTATITNS